jgi:hypothetical protein
LVALPQQEPNGNRAQEESEGEERKFHKMQKRTTNWARKGVGAQV